MSVTATGTVRLQVAGVTLSGTIPRTDENGSITSIDVPAGKTGTLSTRTDNDTGILTVASGHGITTSDKVSVFWDGGSRHNMDVSATTSTTISVDGGTGDNLPTANTAIVVSVVQTAVIEIAGDSVKALAIDCSNRASVQFLSSVPASIVRYDIAAREGRFYISDYSMTNPLAGATVASIKAANGGTTATTVNIGVLRTTN